MTWNCPDIEERLSDFIERQLSPEDARAFSAHVSACAKCAELVESVGGLVTGMHALEMVPEPAGLNRRILVATIGPRETLTLRERWLRWTLPFRQPRLAMGAVTFAAFVLIVFQVSGVKWSHVRRMEFSPASVVVSTNRQAHLVYGRTTRFFNDLRVVYEIESRLQPQPEVMPQPQSPSLPPQTQPAPETSPQQKSDNDKPKDRSQIRNAALVAMLTPFENGVAP